MNIPTNTLNKIFPPLYGQAIGENPANLVDGVRKALQIRGYPSDVEFQARLKDSRLYGSGERAERVKLILETLEDAYQHKEKLSFDTLSIEHIMPQTLTEWWKNHLDEYWAADHDIYLHTLGNLTLTGYNAELSNDTFPKKQQRFIESNLELNHYFKDVERWTKVEIEKRSEALSKLALSIWTYFGDNQFTEINIDDVTGKKPKILTILGQQIAVNTWRDVLKQTLNTIADIEPEGFNILVKEYPSYIGLDSSIFRESQQLNNGYFVELNFSAKAVYNLCTQAIELIDLSPEDWKVETESKKVNEYETNKDIL
ncbi:MAG: HNH endonuclease family protein [Proteobacteria bacterium]|nr:HNH endonuclease family protein [Pseudomonadota bacterium]